MTLFPFLPGFDVEVQDQGLRITRPIQGPKVTVLGVTDKTDIDVRDPFLLERREDLVKVDLVDGTPSEITKAATEAFDGGAENVEVVVIAQVNPATGGYTDNDRYTDLESAYDALFNTDVDIVAPVGAYIDSPGLTGNFNFGYQLADFCYQTTVNNNTAVGVIGVSAPTTGVATTGNLSLDELESHVAALEVYDTSLLNGAAFTLYDGTTDIDADRVPENYGMVATSDRTIPGGPLAGTVVKDGRGNFVDIGAYLSVVATWSRFATQTARRVNPELQYYNSTAAHSYAGRIASLDSWSAPTNKPLPAVRPIRELSLSQANRLAGKRFVSMITKPLGFVTADAMTGAYNISDFARSDFTRLTTVRIVHDSLNFIRRITEPFIGEPNNGANRAAMETAIDRALKRLQALGALEDFEFSLISTPTQRVLGQVLVDLVLVPAFEIRTIQVRVALNQASA